MEIISCFKLIELKQQFKHWVKRYGKWRELVKLKNGIVKSRNR